MVVAVSTLGSGASTLGAVVIVCEITLGVDAWDVGSDVERRGMADGDGGLTLRVAAWDVGSDVERIGMACEDGGWKMARRLSTDRSCAWQLS